MPLPLVQKSTIAVQELRVGEPVTIQISPYIFARGPFLGQREDGWARILLDGAERCGSLLPMVTRQDLSGSGAIA